MIDALPSGMKRQHRLKEFLYLAVSALMSRSNLVRISLIFNNQRWIGTFGKDNGWGGFWYQLEVRVGSLISISFGERLIAGNRLIDGVLRLVLPACPRPWARTIFILCAAFLLTHSWRQGWTTFNLYRNCPRASIHNPHSMYYWPRPWAGIAEKGLNVRLVSESHLDR